MNDPGLDAPIHQAAEHVEGEQEEGASDGVDDDNENYLKPRCADCSCLPACCAY